MKPYYDEDGITIYHGDCREIMVDLTLDRFSVVTDPPYGTGWKLGGEGIGEFKPRDVREPWDVFDIGWLSLLPAVPQTWAIFCPDQRVADLGAALGKFRLRYYVKSNPRPPLGGNDTPSVEPCVIAPRVRFSKGPAHMIAYNGDAEHPCQKPAEIMGWIVRDCTAEDEVVVDPFMGSGTTLVAAKNLGRKAIGIEIEERYCEIAAKRLAQRMLFA